MTEIVIRNKEFQSLLDETIDKFLAHEKEMVRLATRTMPGLQHTIQGAPEFDELSEGNEKYCQPEHLWKLMQKGEEHVGFPEEGYGFQISMGVTEYPEIFRPLHDWTKNELVRVFGANNNSLTSYYPPKGFVGWHTNWNAFGYQIILTWSESGDGYFQYYDMQKEEIVRHDDVKGWQARWYRFGRIDEPEHHCWHSAWTNCPRFTLAFKFPYGLMSEKHDQAYDAIQDLIYDIENG